MGSTHGYGEEQARKGLWEELPPLESFPNRFPTRDYVIEIVEPEYTSVCPKTGMPDFGVVTVTYVPENLCLELKAYKLYMYAYRNLGIFYENLVNRIASDISSAINPRALRVRVDMTPRGGISSHLEVTLGRGELLPVRGEE